VLRAPRIRTSVVVDRRRGLPTCRKLGH
jgi:hypothetical protein